MIKITLCPNCRTIQKAGTTCSICKCPVSLPQPKPQPEVCETKPAQQSLPLVTMATRQERSTG